MSEKKAETIPKRALKLYQVVIYGIGCGIGGSVFILLGNGIRIAGPGILISFIIGGILIFFTALNYAELSTSLPIEGGSYNFSKEGLGGFLAFIIGFFLWIANIAACSFSAQTFALVINEMLKEFQMIDLSPFLILIAILAILFTTLVIFRTQKIAINTLIHLTIILLALFIFFIICSFIYAPFKPDFDPSFISTSFSFVNVLYATPFLFIFFTSILSNMAYLNSELKSPSKNIPKANIISVLVSLSIYLTVTFGVLLNLGSNAESVIETPILLSEVLFNILSPLGYLGFYMMIIAAIISTLIAINAGLGSAVNVLAALSRDKYFPEKIKRVKESSQMPSFALILTAIIAIIFTYFAGIGLAAETTTFIFFFGLAFVNYAAVKLRRKRKELDRPFKAPFFPYLPYFISGTFIVFALFFFSPAAILLGILVLSIGLGYYLLTIADRHSKIITLAGIKFSFVIFTSIFIFLINNFSLKSSSLITVNRILIGINIFTLITIVFEIISLREIVYFFVKRIDKEKIAISVGSGQIIELGRKQSRIIYFVNNIIAFFQIISAIIILIIIVLFLNNIVIINPIVLDETVISPETVQFLFNSLLTLNGISIFLSGIFSWYTNKELSAIGI